jgi:hypothetical protein
MRTMLVLLLAVGSVGSAVALDPLRFQWDSPVGIVTRLYHDYAFSAVLDFNAPYGPVENEPRRVLEKYFDATLTEDLLRDQRCAVQSGGVCNLALQPVTRPRMRGALAETPGPTLFPAVAVRVRVR